MRSPHVEIVICLNDGARMHTEEHAPAMRCPKCGHRVQYRDLVEDPKSAMLTYAEYERLKVGR